MHKAGISSSFFQKRKNQGKTTGASNNINNSGYDSDVGPSSATIIHENSLSVKATSSSASAGSSVGPVGSTANSMARSTVSQQSGPQTQRTGRQHHHHHHRRKGRSKSSTRYVDAEKPKKKVLGNASSLMSIPNTVKLSMLNSGFISISTFQKLFASKG